MSETTMTNDDGSITQIAWVLPEPYAWDNAARLAETVARLKAAPFSPAGKSLFERAATALIGRPDAEITNNADFAMCLLLIARFRMYDGDAFSGIGPANDAVQISRRLNDKVLLAKGLALFGTVHVETGNYPEAFIALSEALIVAQEAEDPAQEVAVLSNLGLAHQYSGHYGEAVPCYERASDVATSYLTRYPDAVAQRSAKAVALANLSLACLHMRDLDRGLSAAEEAIATLDKPVEVLDRVFRSAAECYYTRLLLEVRNVDKARERAQFARDFAAGTTGTAEMLADMAQGLVECHDPATRDVGLSRLQRVVNNARKGTASTLRDALASIVRGYEIAGQPNAALVYLHEVVQLNMDSRVTSVLRHHERHLANLHFKRDRAAQSALEEHLEELRFKRLSIDRLHECMLVLEQNTVAAELHDDETGEHCYRVGALSRELAIAKGMDAEMCNLIDLSARLHDIGKLRVPDTILLKPGRFTPGERQIMEKHCEHGWELIGRGSLPQLFVAQEIALNHHERWDGTGYPNRRQGNMIPLAARVTAIADVFDALTHRRCYKEAWSIDDSMREIGRLRGRHFDPELTDLFLDLVPALIKRHGDLDRYLGAAARKNDFVTQREKVARAIKTDYGTFDIRR